MIYYNKNKSNLIFILLFFSKLVFPQASEDIVTTVLYDSTYEININSQLPPFIGIFKIFELQNEETYSSLYHLQLINSIDSSLFYELKDTINDFTYWPDFDFKDINFDGFKDLWIVVHRDVQAQESYKFLIFNQNKNSFVLNEEFSDSLVCNLSLNPKDSTITSGCKSGCMGFCGSERKYQVRNDHLILIESTDDEQEEVNGEWRVKTTVQKLVNGKMKVVNVYYSH